MKISISTFHIVVSLEFGMAVVLLTCRHKH